MKLTPEWICGFVEGEGTFFISIEKQPKMILGFQVRLGFKITQGVKNVKVLYEIKSFFKVGVVRPQRKNKKVWEYRVSNFTNMSTIIIPFFEKQTLYTTKKFDFLRVRYVMVLMRRQEHLTAGGLKKIQQIRERMGGCTFGTLS